MDGTTMRNWIGQLLAQFSPSVQNRWGERAGGSQKPSSHQQRVRLFHFELKGALQFFFHFLIEVSKWFTSFVYVVKKNEIGKWFADFLS